MHNPTTQKMIILRQQLITTRQYNNTDRSGIKWNNKISLNWNLLQIISYEMTSGKHNKSTKHNAFKMHLIISQIKTNFNSSKSLILLELPYTRNGFSNAGEDGRSNRVDQQLLFQQCVQQQRNTVRWTEILQHLNEWSTTTWNQHTFNIVQSWTDSDNTVKAH